MSPVEYKILQNEVEQNLCWDYFPADPKLMKIIYMKTEATLKIKLVLGGAEGVEESVILQRERTKEIKFV